MLWPFSLRTIAAFQNAIRFLVRGFLAWYRRPRWLPDELAGARLTFAEKTFSIHRPIRLIARVDRAYDNGTVIALLELKVRPHNRIYKPDLIELSAQRAAVQLHTGRAVAPHGFVLLFDPATRQHTVRKVALLSVDEVAALAHRRLQLLEGSLKPLGPGDAACCTSCEYAMECAGALLPHAPTERVPIGPPRR